MGKIGMTVAINMMRLERTYKDMAELNRLEIKNHTNIINNLQKAIPKMIKKNPELALIYMLEIDRNKEHKKGHERMVRIYESLG